jgi:two-component system chemotaxis response regulator CheB
MVVKSPLTVGERVRIQLSRVVEGRLVHVTPTQDNKWVVGCAFDGELDESEVSELVRSTSPGRQVQGERRGPLSAYTCPDCGGTLWQVDDKELTRFRCHIGHVYNGVRLLAEQAKMLEEALWTAVRILKEKTALARQLATREQLQGNLEAATGFQDQSQLAERQSELIKKHILQAAPLSSAEEGSIHQAPGGEPAPPAPPLQPG